MTVTAYMALGSNVGDRQENLEQALEALQEQPGITVTQVSSFIETDPVGGPPGQDRYLNAAAELSTDLSARELLGVFLNIESQLGRVRREQSGPRTIDLDLLLMGNFACHEEGLIVPHPRMHRRLFVLQPLAEIAPRLIHPVIGRTIGDLFLDLRHERVQSKYAPTDSSAEKTSTEPEVRPERELTGLRALVTGSTSGIGRAIAIELAAGGADVIVHGRREYVAGEVADCIRRRGVRASIILADLHDAHERDRMVQSAWNTWSGLDIWINNAGADTLTGQASHWTFERKLDELWGVDVRPTIHLSREIGQRMKEQKTGVIVNMGWDQAETGMEGDSGQLFSASKGAIMAFTRSLALALAPEVRVNCLAPGWIRTAWGAEASEFWQRRVLRETPLGRWGLPTDVGVAARWLASAAAGFITGQTFRVNGGAVRG